MSNPDPDLKRPHPTTPSRRPQLWVEIRLKESLQPHWEAWFGDLALDTLHPGQARLSGAIPDQAALHGILERIRDLNLQIVSVQVQEQPAGLPACSQSY